MPELHTYHPKKGIITINPKKMGGRIHKLKQTRRFIKGIGYCTRYTLMRIGEKIIKTDKKGKEIFRHNNWGVAVKRGRRGW